MKMNYKSTNQHRLSTQNLFQVRVSYTAEPPPVETLLTSGERMGRFKMEKSGSSGECSNKYISFDFAADTPIDQFFVVFKWKQTAADGELPEVKMYAEMESWKWQGDFFNSLGRKRLLAPKATCNWLGTGLAGTVMMVWMLLCGFNT